VLDADTDGAPRNPHHPELTMTEVFIPDAGDRDEQAEAEMHQGKPGNELHDPWFPTPEHAQTWEPPDDFESEEN
jgi:hypothetical protein